MKSECQAKQRLKRCTPQQAHAATLMREAAEQLLDVAMTIATTGETEACDWIIADAEVKRLAPAIRRVLRAFDREEKQNPIEAALGVKLVQVM